MILFIKLPIFNNDYVGNADHSVPQKFIRIFYIFILQSSIKINYDFISVF